jgi:hypothetical protein
VKGVFCCLMIEQLRHPRTLATCSQCMCVVSHNRTCASTSIVCGVLKHVIT